MSESATATYEWHQLPRRTLEVAVFKLERRLDNASQAGDIRRGHRLQKLLLKSGAAKLLAVRRVTQDNQGKNTAGIDGIKSLMPRQRYALAEHLGKRPIGRPTRRVWIPKPGTDERRPLSIPTLHDRALQALVKLLLEPEWEARFEPNRDGFRPGRSVHEAIGAIFIAIEKQPKYALDADIATCIDRIDQDALLVRQYPASQYNTSRGRGFKTLITPSKAAVNGHWAKLSELISQNKAAKQANLIGVLNPVIAGWANYYRAVVSTKTFQLLDHRLYEKLRPWAFFRHPRKGRRWVIHRYWETTPGQSWDFRDRDGPTRNQHGRVPIVRHVNVQGKTSPFDGNWRYWAARRGKYPGVPRRLAALLKQQEGRCQACGLFFKPDDLIELHHLDGHRSDNRYINLAAVHRHCHDQIHGGLHELSKR